MYARDTAAIQAFVARATAGWERRAGACAVAVSFTIRCYTERVLGHLRDFSTGQTTWSPQRRAVIGAYRDGTLFEALRLADQKYRTVATGREARTIAALTLIPGLGYVKAGFLAQMLFSIGGCLDSRNQKAYGITAPPAPGKNLAWCDRVQRAQSYLDDLAYVGTAKQWADTSEALWDRWCNDLALERPQCWPDGDAVSAEHVQWVHLAWHGLEREGN